MNVLIICANGVSSGILALKIEKELNDCGIGGTCIAASQLDLESVIDGKDYILVGPQLRIMFKKLEKQVDGRLPIALIDSVDYGTMNVKNIVKKVREAVGK